MKHNSYCCHSYKTKLFITEKRFSSLLRTQYASTDDESTKIQVAIEYDEAKPMEQREMRES